MKTKLFLPLAATALAVLLGACESRTSQNLTRVNYPITYQVHVGNSQVASAYGPQSMNTNATQDVDVDPGTTFYYQVVSPIPINSYLYEKVDPSDTSTWRAIRKDQGTVISSSFTPSTSQVQFAFGVVTTNTSAMIQFTLSDRPIPQPVVQYTNPPVQYVTPQPTVQVVTPAPTQVIQQQ